MRYIARISGSVVVIMILSVLLVASIPTTRAGFVLASWDYPDEYGQGIETVDLYQNLTGSWVEVGNGYDYDEENIIEWPEFASIKIICFTWFNSTRAEAGSTAEGQLFQRHNVSVSLGGSEVFSQQNFTYVDVNTTLAPIWIYSYEVILNLIPENNEYYTVTIVYEVSYRVGWWWP